jgi:hypothetical protein
MLIGATGRQNEREVAGEDPAEQPLEEEASTFADAGQPIEGSDDGVEHRSGDEIADEQED